MVNSNSIELALSFHLFSCQVTSSVFQVTLYYKVLQNQNYKVSGSQFNVGMGKHGLTNILEACYSCVNRSFFDWETWDDSGCIDLLSSFE